MESSVEMKSHCIEALTRVGAPTEVCNFYADVLQCEYDMTHMSYRMQKDLRDELDKKPIDSSLLFIIIQKMTKKFYYWKTSIDHLSKRGTDVPALRCSPDRFGKNETMKALCTLETKEMNLVEGEELTITDTTHPNRLRVRNSKGEEGYVPALCCILPTPDNSATTAVERLQVHLLTSWTECTRKVKALLFDNLKVICNLLSGEWNDRQSIKERERVNRRFRRLLDAINRPTLDLNRLHSTLFSLEKELISIKADELSKIIITVTNLDKAVLCYQNFHKQWRYFRNDLRDSPKPIRLVEQLNHLRQIAHGKNFKYYEIKMTLEDTESTEEIRYVKERNKSLKQQHSGGTGSGRHEAVTTEQLTSSTQEEQKRFIIRSVIDPSTGKDISMKDAITAGIIDPSKGLYVNTFTGETKPIQVAMNDASIRVEYANTTKSVEKKKALGLITIRTRVDHREITLTGAIDAITAEKVDAVEARRRGLIEGGGDGTDTAGGFYVNGLTRERIPLSDAVDMGWAFGANEDETGAGEYETHTYAVSDVADKLLQIEVSFSEAIRRGLLDTETGNYVNNVTKEQTFLADAIRLGYVKARVVEDAIGLNISTANTVVVERINRIKKNVFRGLKVMSAFKQAVDRKASE